MTDQPSKYQVSVRGSQGAIVGDHTRVDRLHISQDQTLEEEAVQYAETGLAHLEHRSYDMAARAFEESIERSPGSSLLHYHLGVARLGGCSPNQLRRSRVRSVEEALEQSLASDPADGRPALLLAFVRYDHYVRHCRRYRGRGPIALFQLAVRLGLSPDLIAEVRRHAPIDPMLQKLTRGR